MDNGSGTRGIVALLPVLLTRLVVCLDSNPKSNVFVPAWEYNLVRDPSFGIERGLASFQFSLATCAIQCQLDFGQDCHSFFYNAHTQLCTPGTFPRVRAEPPSVQEGQLYVTPFALSCDAENQYEMVTDGTNYYCAYFSNAPLTWTEARDFCQGIGSHLVTVETRQQIIMYIALAVSNVGRRAYLWTGLNDVHTENTFVWDHDGSVMSPEIIELFKTGNPDNYMEEDCVQMQLNFINDVKCANTRYFICQGPVVYLA